MSPRDFSILIVSTDRALLRRMSRFLGIFGYDVRQASSEAAALAAAEANPPDFLLVDGQLKQSNSSVASKQICRQIRRCDPQVSTYCLLLVADLEVAALSEALEAGFDDFLARDVVYGELLARLRAGARVLEYERRLGEQNGSDPVTGLSERTAWLRNWTAWQQAAVADKSIRVSPYLAVLDFDSFGRFARIQGLLNYRDLLRTAAQTVQQALPANSLAGVLHDNRLAILFTAADEEAAAATADSWLQALRSRPLKVLNTEVQATASIGYTGIQANEPADITLQRATTALQLAKISGRNCVVHSDEVDDDQQSWTAMAAEGRLFSTTVARDVMTPCPLLLGAEETVEQGLALAEQTQLPVLPVVDAEGRILGTVTAARLQTAHPPGSRPRQASVRLVRHVMQTDFARFEETTSLNEMMEHFAESEQDVAIVVRDQRPAGFVFCQGLAALNERLNVAAFQPACVGIGSEHLLVSEIYASDTE